MRGSSSLRAFSMGIFVTTTILWGVRIYDGQEDSPPSKPSLTEESVQEYLKEKDYMAIPKREYMELTNKTKEKNQQQVPEPSPPQIATIQIQQGTRAVEVAKLLEQQGVVKSASEFQQYLANAQLTDKLRVGTYQITPNMSFTQIANILTKQVVQE